MSEALEAWMLPHTCAVREFLGAGGMGERFADPVERACFAEESVKLVRDADGAEVVSTAQVTLDFEPALPVGSMVAWWGGSERRVMSVERLEAPGWPAYQTLFFA